MLLLVTGGSGNLGRPLVRALLERTDHRLRIFGRREPPAPLGSRVEWAEGDVRNKADLNASVAGVDVILHLAARSHSNRPRGYDSVNVTGTANLLEAARAGGVRRLFLFSSYVASPDGGAYARSKLLAEEAVRGSGADWIILRPAEVYGPGQSGTLSSLIGWARAGAVVPIVGHGGYRLSPIHVEDLVAAVLALLERPELSRRTYTLAGPETMTLHELVDRVAAFHGVRPLRIRLPVALLRLAALAARAAGLDRPALDQLDRLRVERSNDIVDARRELGFHPRSLEEGLAAMSEAGGAR